jgi:hypothetical protein
MADSTPGLIMKTLPALIMTVVLFSHASATCAATIITAGTDAELRAAVAACGPIMFNFDGVITVTSAIPVTCAVTIDATGHAVTISGGNSNRIFNVLPGATLNLIGLTVANGRVVGTNGLRYRPEILVYEHGEPVQAGGILVTNATLTARDCTFANCRLQSGNGAPVADGNTLHTSGGWGGAAQGGAVAAYQSSIAFSNCLFVANAAMAGLSGASSFYINFPAVPGDGAGGAVHAMGGSVSITNCQFRGNSASRNGGGLFASNAVSSAVQTIFATNSTLYNGGAAGLTAGTMFLRKCVFQNNAVSGPYVAGSFFSGDHGGGAIRMDSGFVSVDECDFAGNQAVAASGYSTIRGPVQGTPGYGGALAQMAGTSVISRATFRANAAFGGASASTSGAQPASGGAIYFGGGKMDLLNCTLAQNSVRPGVNSGNGTSALGSGGGIHSGALLTISSCTIASNRASDFASNQSQGGGVYAGGGTVELRNTILAGNSVNSIASSNWFGQAHVDLGRNLSSDSTPTWSGGTSLNNTDARLFPLASNGGPTPTMALRVGSPALNFASPTNSPATDQRGVARPQGAGPDAGAWEGAGGQSSLRVFRQPAFPQLNTLSWPSDTGVTYRVERATTLNNWTVLATNLPGNGATVLLDITNTGAAYFRVATEP